MNISTTNLFFNQTYQSNVKDILKQNSELSNKEKKSLLELDSYQQGVELLKGLGNANNAGKMQGSLSKLMLDALNFDSSSLQCADGVYTLNNISFTADQISSIDSDSCKEIQAVNNVVSFENSTYYKYTDASGEEHIMSCANNHLGTSFSDEIRGIVDSTNNQTALFWNLLAKDGTYLESHYSSDEIKGMLNNAGITEGFFTVKAGNKQQEYFYSNGNSGTAISKEHYDATYKALTTTGGLFGGYASGTTVVVDGESYTLGEDGTVDVPYGADIFNISCSRNNG